MGFFGLNICKDEAYSVPGNFDAPEAGFGCHCKFRDDIPMSVVAPTAVAMMRRGTTPLIVNRNAGCEAI